ncbi:hypothetical protein LCGC14_0234970 [marine sediment metagenome]|uniref:Uncharacterized protein n=1 Tax=marine sediment metagenome TaxID=412755 RepID=A0A0F9WTM1_9ZZZZ
MNRNKIQEVLSYLTLDEMKDVWNWIATQEVEYLRDDDGALFEFVLNGDKGIVDLTVSGIANYLSGVSNVDDMNDTKFAEWFRNVVLA